MAEEMGTLPEQAFCLWPGELQMMSVDPVGRSILFPLAGTEGLLPQLLQQLTSCPFSVIFCLFVTFAMLQMQASTWHSEDTHKTDSFLR